MATKPLTSEAIALTEKKMDMTLDDIIKMSKNNTANAKKQRVFKRSKKFVNNAAQDKAAKLQRFMDTRSTIRQGALAQRRSNFQGNQFPLPTEAARKTAGLSQRRSNFQGHQFPLATEAARKAAAVPIRNRPFNGIRVVNVNKARVGAPTVQRWAVNGGGFNVKQSQQVKVPPKQRQQTLDSLFANMKEERMRLLSQQNNPARRNGGGQRLPPWQRGRFAK